MIEVIGTTVCPECGQTARVFRRGFRNPLNGKPIYAVSLHWIGSDKCPGAGRRVALDRVTR